MYTVKMRVFQVPRQKWGTTQYENISAPFIMMVIFWKLDISVQNYVHLKFPLWKVWNWEIGLRDLRYSWAIYLQKSSKFQFHMYELNLMLNFHSIFKIYEGSQFRNNRKITPTTILGCISVLYMTQKHCISIEYVTNVISVSCCLKNFFD